MTVRYIVNGLLPLLAASLSGWLVGLDVWDGLKQGLLVALSVIAAGVLVRLARGLPFTNVDHYEVGEIRDLTAAVIQIVRSLRLLVGFVLATMVLLTLALPIQRLLQSYAALLVYAQIIDRVISCVIGLSLAYVLIRMTQVIAGDVDLTVLQSKFIVRAVERKQAKMFDATDSAKSMKEFKTPENYGKLIQ